ncbi:DUF2306 domain-containing protein [Kutzneria kofuensis]|uniref:DUF2306 domain-containing protein n=1 Tax=Kutzneria kofuensis TaxID=103725 RepID=A0A7W9NKJ3_9PSEU|nr:DUF2306 domain-containing protein [Kutzneria kofuensis]MBB5896090.1 hypothetical protein [Kutzneria kofuensis]
MLADQIVVGGLPVPDDRPVFLAALAVHVAAGAGCVVAGALAALARKRRGRHPRAGIVYYWALVCSFAALVALAVLRWPHDVDLLTIGTVAVVAGTAGLVARRRHRPGWFRIHGTGMAVSYMALLTGFYVDNGPNLPLWNLLPHITYWLLPAVVGVPLLLRALRRAGRQPPSSSIVDER